RRSIKVTLLSENHFKILLDYLPNCFLLEPQQRVIPLVSVRTLFFKSDPKWALPVSQATYI
ncbi:hypothetical protein, partial [Agathobacter rectalis]|uniref:hypothetical protein n=1 Tax=Agathobacter rectalis TaxID=39491 RepID=UPI0027D28C4C